MMDIQYLGNQELLKLQKTAFLASNTIPIEMVLKCYDWATEHFVDNGADVTGKKLSHMKYSSKRSDFLRFYAYLCHGIDDFACL